MRKTTSLAATVAIAAVAFFSLAGPASSYIVGGPPTAIVYCLAHPDSPLCKGLRHLYPPRPTPDPSVCEDPAEAYRHPACCETRECCDSWVEEWGGEQVPGGLTFETCMTYGYDWGEPSCACSWDIGETGVEG